MKFLVEYPVSSERGGGEWISPDGIRRFAKTAEEAGIDALAFTDHPAPSAKWLRQGGHETFDPFAALAFCAAVTTRLRLMTRLVVLPYRNPLATAKSLATVDVLSGGRATFVLGAGYLRSEFAALGVDFAERNALFDEAVEVLRNLWTTEEFRFAGRRFTALGVTSLPRPVQLPHPPLWLGGNSSVVLDRVARFGAGWSPMLGDPSVAAAARTRSITSHDELRGLLDDLVSRMAAAGRNLDELDIAVPDPAADLRLAMSPDERRTRLAELAKLGVTYTVVRLDPAADLPTTCAQLAELGRAVGAAQPCSSRS